jgi:hypothetical protein
VGKPQRAVEALQTFIHLAADDPIAVTFVARARELLAELGAAR